VVARVTHAMWITGEILVEENGEHPGARLRKGKR
jgi:hypothetical protein